MKLALTAVASVAHRLVRRDRPVRGAADLVVRRPVWLPKISGEFE
jgi:hypothetical protein